MPVLANVGAAVDAVADVDLPGLSDEQVRAGFEAMVLENRRTAALGLAFYAEAEIRGLPRQWGYTNGKNWLESQFSMSGREIWRHHRYAATLSPRTAMTGEPLPPQWLGTSKAFDEGAISMEHVHAIGQVMDTIPTRIPAPIREEAEKCLAEVARYAPPKKVLEAGAHILASLDPDGTPEDDRDRKRRRGVTIGVPDINNMRSITGWLDPEAAAVLGPLLAAWGRKGINDLDDTDAPAGHPDTHPGPDADPADPGNAGRNTGNGNGNGEDRGNGRGGASTDPAAGDDPWTDSPPPTHGPPDDPGSPNDPGASETASPPGSLDLPGSGGLPRNPGPHETASPPTEVNSPETTSPPTESGPRDGLDLAAAIARDTRTLAQRNHDALVAMARYLQRNGVLKTHRGVDAIPIITMSITDLEHAAGVATTATGGTVSIPDALKIAQQCRPVLMLFDPYRDQLPLYLGRGSRIANLAQRLALYASHRGCTGPNCTTPAIHTQIHHAADPWVDGGETNIDELTPACDKHHALITGDTERDWHTRIVPDGLPDAGATAWIPPARFDPTRRPRVNRQHDPLRLLHDAEQRLAGNPPPELTALDLGIPTRPAEPTENDWDTDQKPAE